MIEAKENKEEQKLDNDKPKTIRMPSEGQRFKLWNTKFEVTKTKGTWFQAMVIEND